MGKGRGGWFVCVNRFLHVTNTLFLTSSFLSETFIFFFSFRLGNVNEVGFR